MRLQDKMLLRDILNHGNYFKIAIWADGTWVEVGDNYGGEKSGNNPTFIVPKAYFGEMTHEAIAIMFRKLEAMRFGE
jgi:hypothetical protein